MFFLSLDIFFMFEEDVSGWHNIASSVRGVWGRILKKLYCYQRQLECKNCPMTNCSYYTIYEKKYGENGQYHPYIILPSLIHPNQVRITFKLFGWACNHYEKIVYSLLEMQKAHFYINGKRVLAEIRQINDFFGNCVFYYQKQTLLKPRSIFLEFKPEKRESMVLKFITPLRQKSDDRLMNTFKWESFIKSLINRIRFINNAFNDSQLNIPDFISIDGVQVLSHDFVWQEQKRKSFRQNQVMSLGGLIGETKLSNVPPDCFGILKLGTFLHAGKQTTFGNGCYKIIYEDSKEVL